MEEFDFEKWWIDNFENKRFASGNEELLVIERMMIDFEQDIQIKIINEFVKRDYIYFICQLIPKYGSDLHKQLIREKFLKWFDSGVDDLNGQDYIRCILLTYSDSDYNLIIKYFLNPKPLWFFIPAELYHVDRNLFLSSFEKYLPKFDDEKLYEYETLSYLTYDLEALTFLIDNLSAKQSKRIKRFCSIQSNRLFYNDETKEKLEKLSN